MKNTYFNNNKKAPVKHLLCTGFLMAVLFSCGTEQKGSSSSSSSSISSSSSSSSSSGLIHANCQGQASDAFQDYIPTVPGLVEAEDFDIKGFSDTTDENEGGDYRSDVAVDIKKVDGGNVVGWMSSGEWLEYTVNVEREGDYDVTIRAAAVDSGRTLSLSQCGDTLLDAIEVPKVSSWGDYKTASVGKVHLTPGLQKIRIKVGDKSGIDFDWIHIGSYGGTIDPPLTSCEMPSSFNWTSTPPVVTPGRSNWASVKDPTIVQYDGKYHVWATTYSGGWKSIYFNFEDWATADDAPQTLMEGSRVGNTIAPQVFYFTPQKKWYLITQWGGAYATTDNINDVSSWSSKKGLLQGEPKNSLDFWVICDDTHCHMFFSRDDGVLYKSKTTIANFPNFSGSEIVMEDHRGNGNSFLFEAANVYKIDGSDKYLLLVEAYKTPGYGPRYFRSWTSTSLDGPWEALADTEEEPFAGEKNVEWPDGKWSRGISHGELVRSGYDEKLTIDPCNLEFLYQGEAGASPGTYGETPYRLGILRPKK